MTTTPIEQPAGDSSIPRCFRDLALESAAQHGALLDCITQVEVHLIEVKQRVAQAETRIIRWVVGSAAAVVGALAAMSAAAVAAVSVWG